MFEATVFGGRMEEAKKKKKRRKKNCGTKRAWTGAMHAIASRRGEVVGDEAEARDCGRVGCTRPINSPPTHYRRMNESQLTPVYTTYTYTEPRPRSRSTVRRLYYSRARGPIPLILLAPNPTLQSPLHFFILPLLCLSFFCLFFLFKHLPR